jgi:hypothetical protein
METWDMSALIDIVSLAAKTVSGARIAGRVLGRETPELDELHSAFAPARRKRLQTAPQNNPSRQPVDDDSEDGDDGMGGSDVSGPVGENTDIDADGVLGVVVDTAHWIMDKIDQVF